jgi:hypothetical protein
MESVPYLTANDSGLVYALESGGDTMVRWLDFPSGQQRSLTPAMESRGFTRAIPNKTGSQVTFSERDDEGFAVRVIPVSGGAMETLCPDVDITALWSWSWNGRFLAHRFSVSPITIGVLDVETCERIEILKYPGGSLFQAEFSPGDQWIAFMGSGGIAIAPFEGLKTIDPSNWIKVFAAPADKPRWAPDGKSLYFTSQQEGNLLIYRQTLDPVSKRPVGEPSVIHRFGGGRFSFREVPLELRDISVSTDRIVFPLVELTGNVWLMEQ